MRLPCLTLSWTHWLFDLKSNNGCHSISFQLSALGFIFRKKKMHFLYITSLQVRTCLYGGSGYLFLMQEEFSIFNKHFKILSFSLCIVWGPILQSSYFPQQMFYGKVYMETCVWNFNPFGMHRKSLPIKELCQHFEKSEESSPSLITHKLSKTGFV